MLAERKYAREAQNHEGFVVKLFAPDGTELGSEEVVFSDGVWGDGSAGELYVQNGEQHGVFENLTALADKFINGDEDE